MRNLPYAQGVEYLKAQGVVRILAIEGRVKLFRDNDYLVQCRVATLDKQALAYARFHCGEKQGPLKVFNAGHLKVPLER